MSFQAKYTYVTTLRLDAEEQALLDALVARERLFKVQLFRQGLRLLGRGAPLPKMDPPRTKPTVTVRLEAHDEKILNRLFHERSMPKETLLRGGIRVLAREKGVSKTRKKATAA